MVNAWPLALIGLFLMLNGLLYGLAIRKGFGGGAGFRYAIRQAWASGREVRAALVILAIRSVGIGLIGLNVVIWAFGATPTRLIPVGVVVTALTVWPFRKIIQRLVN